jgi:hypothetical protein
MTMVSTFGRDDVVPLGVATSDLDGQVHCLTPSNPEDGVGEIPGSKFGKAFGEPGALLTDQVMVANI